MTGLSAGTTFYYRVRVYNSTGGQSTNPTAITVVVTDPVAPVLLPADPDNNTNFTAKWNNSTGASSYRLDVATSASFGSTILASYNNLNVGNVTSKIVTGLDPGITYHYRVRAHNTGGTSASQTPISVVTLSDVPGLSTASGVEQAQFAANWQAAQGAAPTDGYRLDVATSASFGGTTLAGYNNLTVNGVTQIVSGLTPGTNYYYRVRSVNSLGVSSANSAGIENIMTLATVPALDPASGVSLIGFTANWQASTGVALTNGYHLDVATSASFGGTTLAGYNNLTVDGLTQTVNGLTPGTAYFYRVRSVNTNGASSEKYCY